MTDTYRIVRRFRDCIPDEVMETGLSLEEAKAHCSKKETRGTDINTGPWFDSFEVEQ
jgi:hypothetical protein